MQKMTLKNVVVKSSSSRVGSPKGCSFVSGKNMVVILSKSDVQTFLEIKKLALAKLEAAYPEILIDAVEFKMPYKFDKDTKEYTVRFNITKVPQKDQEFLKDDEGNWQEKICNYIQEDNKYVAKFPLITVGDKTTTWLPFTDSIIDIHLQLNVTYIEEDSKVLVNMGIEEIVIKSSPQVSSTNANKKSSVELDLDADVDFGEKATTTKKAETKKETTKKSEPVKKVVEESDIDDIDELDDLFDE